MISNEAKILRLETQLEVEELSYDNAKARLAAIAFLRGARRRVGWVELERRFKFKILLA